MECEEFKNGFFEWKGPRIDSAAPNFERYVAMQGPFILQVFVFNFDGRSFKAIAQMMIGKERKQQEFYAADPVEVLELARDWAVDIAKAEIKRLWSKVAEIDALAYGPR